MKIFTIFILVLSTYGLINGQSAVFEKNEAKVNFQLDPQADFQDEETYVRIENMTNDDLRLTWVRDEQILPTGWETAICDNVRCWLPSVSTKEVSLLAQESFDFIVHLYPNRLPGDSAVLVLDVTNNADATDNTTLKVTFVNGEITATDDPTNSITSIKIVPNPAYNQVRVQDDLDRVRYAEIYSITGKRAASHTLVQNESMLIDELPSGTYVIRLFDQSKNLIVSRRLQKI